MSVAGRGCCGAAQPEYYKGGQRSEAWRLELDLARLTVRRHQLIQVRFRRYRLSPAGELGYSGIRGAVGLGYSSLYTPTPIVKLKFVAKLKANCC
jgi:hypothetical protein